MTNDAAADALGAWVRERALATELSDGSRAWLATGPSAHERPPASELAELVVALAMPGAVRALDNGALEELAHENDGAMLAALRALSGGYADGQGRMS